MKQTIPFQIEVEYRDKRIFVGAFGKEFSVDPFTIPAFDINTIEGLELGDIIVAAIRDETRRERNSETHRADLHREELAALRHDVESSRA
jgi:hypothetical protein